MLAKTQEYQAVVDGFNTVTSAIQKQFFGRKISFGEARISLNNMRDEFSEENPELKAEFQKIANTAIDEMKQELKLQNRVTV